MRWRLFPFLFLDKKVIRDEEETNLIAIYDTPFPLIRKYEVKIPQIILDQKAQIMLLQPQALVHQAVVELVDLAITGSANLLLLFKVNQLYHRNLLRRALQLKLFAEFRCTDYFFFLYIFDPYLTKLHHLTLRCDWLWVIIFLSYIRVQHLIICWSHLGWMNFIIFLFFSKLAPQNRPPDVQEVTRNIMNFSVVKEMIDSFSSTRCQPLLFEGVYCVRNTDFQDSIANFLLGIGLWEWVEMNLVTLLWIYIS